MAPVAKAAVEAPMLIAPPAMPMAVPGTMKSMAMPISEMKQSCHIWVRMKRFASASPSAAFAAAFASASSTSEAAVKRPNTV